MIGPTVWEWLKLSDPYYLVFAPYTDPGRVGLATYSVFLAACLCLSGMLAALATLRIRAVVARQAGRPAATARMRHGGWTARRGRWQWFPWLPGPSLDGNPVLWRECNRSKPGA